MGKLRCKTLSSNTKAGLDAEIEKYFTPEYADPHSLLVLGYAYDGTDYCALIRYREP